MDNDVFWELIQSSRQAGPTVMSGAWLVDTLTGLTPSEIIGFDLRLEKAKTRR